MGRTQETRLLRHNATTPAQGRGLRIRSCASRRTTGTIGKYRSSASDVAAELLGALISQTVDRDRYLRSAPFCKPSQVTWPGRVLIPCQAMIVPRPSPDSLKLVPRLLRGACPTGLPGLGKLFGHQFPSLDQLFGMLPTLSKDRSQILRINLLYVSE